MVKRVGFIVEGGSEKKIIESASFNNWLASLGLELVKPVIDAKGGGNLLPKNIEPSISILKENNADYIFILTDQEREKSINNIKSKLINADIKDCFITSLALESWFLSDTKALSSWLKMSFKVDDPENIEKDLPFDRLREISLEKRGRGCRCKLVLANQFILHGFNPVNVLEHDNCFSMKYIHKVLSAL